MTLQLNSKNVLAYLTSQGLDIKLDGGNNAIQVKDAKNFNLLLTLDNQEKWLVKQERFNQDGHTSGEFQVEWRIHSLIRKNPSFDLQSLLSEVLLFDSENSILVLRYLDDYQDLLEFYLKEKQYPNTIATALGDAIAQIHRTTYHNPALTSDFAEESDQDNPLPLLSWTNKLQNLEPEVFGIYPAEGIKFFSLYQRFDSLGEAIHQALEQYQSICVIHNDLKLNNVLVLQSWENPPEATPLIRLIDWERNHWGDPSFDLGTLLASYLQQWLGSLLVSQDISFQDSLKMASTPLQTIQPSIVQFILGYLQQFPEIIEVDPLFLNKIIQFAGLVLINQIFATLQYQKTFGNTGICMLQVAKSLLCRPEHSFITVFGQSQADVLSQINSSPRNLAQQLS